MAIEVTSPAASSGRIVRRFRLVAISMVVWIIVYLQLQNGVDWLLFRFVGLNHDSRLSETLRFFFFEKYVLTIPITKTTRRRSISTFGASKKKNLRVSLNLES